MESCSGINRGFHRSFGPFEHIDRPRAFWAPRLRLPIAACMHGPGPAAGRLSVARSVSSVRRLPRAGSALRRRERSTWAFPPSCVSRTTTHQTTNPPFLLLPCACGLSPRSTRAAAGHIGSVAVDRLRNWASGNAMCPAAGKSIELAGGGAGAAADIIDAPCCCALPPNRKWGAAGARWGAGRAWELGLWACNTMPGQRLP